MKAKVLSTHTPVLFADAVKRAAELLRAGEVVALPTETVYGLAANALDARAVARIYEIKGRPAHNPIIVHIADVETAKRCVADWPAIASKLAKAFWPGPLTLVLPKSKEIPDIVTAGGDTVGVRWPGHPFIQAVIRECGFPLAAPSANPASGISPTNAAHVLKTLGNKIPLIVDGGQSQVGIESAVLDLTMDPPRILRPGMIHEESLAAVIGEIQSPKSKVQSPKLALRSPGLLEKHYAPKARLAVLSWSDNADLRSQLSTLPPSVTAPVLRSNSAEGGLRRVDNSQLSKCHIIAHTHIPAGDDFGCVSVIPRDAEAFARAIYAELHRCDEADASLIVVEAPPDTPEWSAIADRLKRAAATEGGGRILPIGRGLLTNQNECTNLGTR